MKRTRFHGQTHFKHGRTPRIGVVLVNLGTPDAPTTPALRCYLGEFLSDPRVVEIPAFIWKIILYGIVLRTRPKKSAQAYARVWRQQGSPLLSHTADLTDAIRNQLTAQSNSPVSVTFAMRYGNPSVESTLLDLEQQGVERLLVMPLYPQYCGATSASSADAIFNTLRRWRWLPELRISGPYSDHPQYIQAVADSIRAQWAQHGQGDKLLFSFHGMPKATLDAGDPYFCHCHKTARLVADNLELEPSQWELAFQSRFGAAEWLQPYASKRFAALPSEGVKHLTVVCPGFAVDCLETIDEISVEGHDDFIKAGGRQFIYVPALNNSEAHAQLLLERVLQQTADWPEWQKEADSPSEQSRTLALKAGAKH